MEDSDDGGLLFESRVELRKPAPNSNMARELIEAFGRHANRVLLVDAQSGRQWTGAELLSHCGAIATNLVRRVGVKVDDVIMTICDRNDSEVVVALAAVLSGAALYPTTPIDGYNEVEMLCELVKPQVLIINSKYHECARKLRQNVAGMSDTRIVWIDGLNRHHKSSSIEAAAAKPLTNGHSHVKNHLDANNNNNNHHLESISECKQQAAILFDNIESNQFDAELIDSIAYEQIASEKHVCNFMLTSGSTGRPKVVPASHAESVWGLYSMISAATIPFRTKRQSPTIVDENNNTNIDANQEEEEYLLPFGGEDVISGDLPLDHGAGLNTMFLSYCLGAKYIVMPSFEVDLFWQAVSDYKITFSISSTSFSFKLFKYLRAMIKEGTAESRFDLSSLKNIVCCGAKVTFVELANEIRAHYPNLVVSQGYGCTENGYIANLLKSEAQVFIDSVGYLMPGIKAKIVDPDRLQRQLGPGERGELLLWSPSLFKGYRCHPEVDAEQVFKNCHDPEGVFYRTGDQAHFDHDGRLYVHGRFKDTLVLMGDWKIMPAELEEVVNEHPLVESSGVVGVPDPDLPGCHKPRAFVKLISKTDALKTTFAINDGDNAELVARLKADDLAFIAEHIREFVAERTAPAKHLTGGVRILDELPRVGLLNKIDRQKLREMS
uniref:Luciferin 4-monooxygenase n=1 Tax=Aceria tosichella TaxID=561515 RepID=A0A6G1SF80_9ACAR